MLKIRKKLPSLWYLL